jgi:hypothetical protein
LPTPNNLVCAFSTPPKYRLVDISYIKQMAIPTHRDQSFQFHNYIKIFVVSYLFVGFFAFYAIFRLTAPFDYAPPTTAFEGRQGKLKINDLPAFLPVSNATL